MRCCSSCSLVRPVIFLPCQYIPLNSITFRWLFVHLIKSGCLPPIGKNPSPTYSNPYAIPSSISIKRVSGLFGWILSPLYIFFWYSGSFQSFIPALINLALCSSESFLPFHVCPAIYINQQPVVLFQFTFLPHPQAHKEALPFGFSRKVLPRLLWFEIYILQRPLFQFTLSLQVPQAHKGALPLRFLGKILPRR